MATAVSSAMIELGEVTRRRGGPLLAALRSTPAERRALRIQLVHPPGVYKPGNLTSLTPCLPLGLDPEGDRKSTRLNSSHGSISYAVFCLKKKKELTWSKRCYPSDGCGR